MRACRGPRSEDFGVVCVYDNVSLLHKGFFFPAGRVFFSLNTLFSFFLLRLARCTTTRFAAAFASASIPPRWRRANGAYSSAATATWCTATCCGRRRGRWAPRPARSPRVATRPRDTHHQVTRRPHSGSRHGKARHPPPKAGPRKTPAPPPSPRRYGVGGTVLHYAPGASEFGQEGRGVCVTACREET